MARPATGSARWERGAWEARITINGKREPVPLPDIAACLVVPTKPPPKCPCDSCSQARRVAKIVSDRKRNDGLVTEGTAETSNEWHTKYLKVHAALGNQTEQHANDWRRFVAEVIGTLPMASVRSEHIKTIRNRLTTLRLEGTIGAKRALNVWSTVVKAPFSRAFTDDDPKYSTVRVGPFATNPAIGIKPPSSKADQEEDERERQALDPSEALALISAESVPLADRRLYAIGMVTGLRPAELFGLLWSDVRLDEQKPIIRVQRARHARTLEEKTTKNRQSVRVLPIHPVLRPLLKAMREEAGNPMGRVLPVAHSYEILHGAIRLREHLLVAGIKRDELQHGTATLKPFDIRSLRTTFATWCSKAGYDSTWVSRWLGHKPAGTAAKHYVKDVPAFEDVVLRPVQPGTIGPFPPLPTSLLGFGGVLVVLPKMTAKGPSKQRFAWVLKPRVERRKKSDRSGPGDRANAHDLRDPVTSPVVPPIASTTSDEATVLAGTRPAESEPRSDPDEALKTAIKVAVDAGDTARAMALLEVLRASPKPAGVVDLASRRTPR